MKSEGNDCDGSLMEKFSNNDLPELSLLKFSIKLPSQPFLSRHFGFHNFFYMVHLALARGHTSFTAIWRIYIYIYIKLKSCSSVTLITQLGLSTSPYQLPNTRNSSSSLVNAVASLIVFCSRLKAMKWRKLKQHSIENHCHSLMS